MGGSRDAATAGIAAPRSEQGYPDAPHTIPDSGSHPQAPWPSRTPHRAFSLAIRHAPGIHRGQPPPKSMYVTSARPKWRPLRWRTLDTVTGAGRKGRSAGLRALDGSRSLEPDRSYPNPVLRRSRGTAEP